MNHTFPAFTPHLAATSEHFLLIPSHNFTIFYGFLVRDRNRPNIKRAEKSVFNFLVYTFNICFLATMLSCAVLSSEAIMNAINLLLLPPRQSDF